PRAGSRSAQQRELVGVFVNGHQRAIVVLRLGVQVEERPVGVGQHEDPLAVALVLHAVDLPRALRLWILREYPHHAALLLPWADDLQAREVDGWDLVEDFAEGLLRGDEELEQPNRREQPGQ